MNKDFALTEQSYFILLSLVQPRHGYAIMQQAELLSAGRIKLAAGTLYGALSALSEKGWIRLLPVSEGSRRKEYCLTEVGLAALRGELSRLRELVKCGETVMGGLEQ